MWGLDAGHALCGGRGGGGGSGLGRCGDAVRGGALQVDALHVRDPLTHPNQSDKPEIVMKRSEES